MNDRNEDWPSTFAQKAQWLVAKNDHGQWAVLPNSGGAPLIVIEEAKLIACEMRRCVDQGGSFPSLEADDRNQRLAKMMAQWYCRETLGAVVQVAKREENLGRLEGMFDDEATRWQLDAAGVWGMKVRVVSEVANRILKPTIGEVGRIETRYPVGLNCFALRLEAPVSELAVKPDAVIGIKWHCLAAVQ